MSLYTWLGSSIDYEIQSPRYNYWSVESSSSIPLVDIDIYNLPVNENQIKVYTMPIQPEQIDEIVEKVIEKLEEKQNENEEDNPPSEETENGETE